MTTVTLEVTPQPQEAHTPELFWEQWGHKADMPAETFFLMWGDAQTWYADWPYHHFEHALETLWACMRIADECEAHGETVNRRVLIASPLFHDAGYFQTTPNAFDDKETYSAAIFGMKAANYNFNVDDVFVGQNAILSTKRGSKVSSLEDKILRIADLVNVSQDYSGFIEKTERIYQEVVQTCAEPPDFWTFKKNSLIVLAEYLDDDLALGEWDSVNGVSHFQAAAAANLRILAEELAAETDVTMETFLWELNHPSVERVLAFAP